MFIDAETLQGALLLLQGKADHMIKIWLVLKGMGLTKDSPIKVNTSNSKGTLKQLFCSGAPDGQFCVPFAPVPSRWRFMKSDAARSIIQTNLKKWMDGTVTGSDPTGYLQIEKEGSSYKVSGRDNYPQGLGEGINGFATSAGGKVEIPMLPMAIWVFAREDVPKDISDPKQYLRDKLRDILNLDHEEEARIFVAGDMDISFSDHVLSEQEIFEICKGVKVVNQKAIEGSRQLITYGAPGTGKSHKVDGLCDCQDVAKCVRTTFHPDSDYSTFVGSYKPTMAGEKIAYEFRPQAFMGAYVEAWKAMVHPDDGKVKNVVLVIEEINRGNCAQIFGDIFQLLDRGNGGYSTYPIDADQDLATWLAGEKQLGNALVGLAKPDDIQRQSDWDDVLAGRKLALPPNLYIWATMNTSDQSLFPIDSAFKRRWDWEYVPIAKPDKSGDANWKERKIEVGDALFDWWDFLLAINGHIAKATESEDKQLGYFFVKADDATGYISAKQFANKVLFYLFGDVFKSYELPKKDCFQLANNTVLAFRDFFYNEKVKEGDGASQVTREPGDVKLETVAAFLRNLKWDGKGVNEGTKDQTDGSQGEH